VNILRNRSVPTQKDTLAAWLAALDCDSPCFCCGSELVVEPSGERHSLVCRGCGARISNADTTSLSSSVRQSEARRAAA
jgi:hypothetical protein